MENRFHISTENPKVFQYFVSELKHHNIFVFIFNINLFYSISFPREFAIF